MTGMERLAAAIHGQPADRVPVFCNLFDQGARELGLGSREYYSRGECVAEGQLIMRRKFGYDNLWSLSYVGREAELMGCRKMIFSNDGPPNVGEMVIRKPEDIAKLRAPENVSEHHAFRETVSCMRILRAEAGGKYPICAYCTATMTLPVLLMGMEKWMYLLCNGPATLRDQLLEKCHALFVAEVRAYRELGADLILYANPFGSTDVVPLKFIREISLPWMERDIRAVGSEGIVYYCGGARMNNVIELVQQRTGIEAYYLSPLDDVETGKKIIAGRWFCGAAINDIKLIGWAREQVESEVRRMMDAGKPGGKFLFGSIMMPMAIPEDNIHAMIDAACKYGSWETAHV